MKTKRSDKSFGGGSGKEIFESDLFRVVVWKKQKGIRTTIECKMCGFDKKDIQFDGKHEFTSDELCLEQLKVAEVVEMIENQKKQAFAAGRANKAEEIRDALELDEW